MQHLEASPRFGPRALLPWLFPIALWALATLALGGDLGRYFDDYFTTLRTPATGEIDLLAPFVKFPFFWRPLHWLYIFHMLAWFHDCLWIPHALTAISHGVAAILLYTLLRRLIRTPHAAAGSALLFAVYPMHHEVTIWIASTSTSMATAVWILLAHLYISIVRGRTGLRAGAGIAALAFAIPCLNEQASAGILALPVLGVLLPARETPLIRRLWLAAWPAALASIMVLVYIVLLRTTAPVGMRGAAGSFLAPGDLLPRLKWIAHELGVVHYQWRLIKGLHWGWRAGLEALPTLVWIAWTAVLVATLHPWLVRWLRTPLRNDPESDVVASTDSPAPCAAPPSPLAVLAFGLTLALTAWLPLLVILGQIAESRMGYFPAVGLAVALAAVVDLLAAGAVRLRMEAVFKPVLATIVALAGWYGAVCLVGYHKAFQDQARADIRQSARLRELVPEPPPGTVFVPLHIAPPETGASSRLREAVVGWLWVVDSATPLIQETYRRGDVRSSAFNPWLGLSVRELDAAGFTYLSDTAPPERLRWDLAVPFIVDAQERVYLVRELVIPGAGGESITVRPPLVARAAAAGADDTVEWTIKPQP